MRKKIQPYNQVKVCLPEGPMVFVSEKERVTNTIILNRNFWGDVNKHLTEILSCVPNLVFHYPFTVLATAVYLCTLIY